MKTPPPPDLSTAAAALGRKGGLAAKLAGVDFTELGRQGGKAGKGTKKPRLSRNRRKS